MTFKIDGTDFSGYLTKYGYSTTYTPVYSDSVQTMDGVEHVVVIRYKGTLTVTIRPLTGAEWETLSAALATGILNIQYTNIQLNEDVDAEMRLDDMGATLALINASRTLFNDTQLTFVEL